MSLAISRAIRACAAGASRRGLASVEAKGAPAAGRWAGRGRSGPGPVEDGARVQWVFLGCPGVGKGTHAGCLSRLLGMPHITTGDLVRDELASSGSLSKQVFQFLALNPAS